MKDVKEIISGIRTKVGHMRVHWHQGLTPFQLLIGTVLSARTRDENTGKAVRRLFAVYKGPRQIASAPLREIKKLIKPAGFYKVKAKRIKELCKILVRKYRGRVPKKREELMSLPGVGQKTSGIVLAFAFGSPTAIPVDTHVFRVSNRIGLVHTKTPEKTEWALMKAVPKRYWTELNELFVLFGQNICTPGRPFCGKCPITKHCDYYSKNVKPNIGRPEKLKIYVRGKL